jgi:hypothetical protein
MADLFINLVRLAFHTNEELFAWFDFKGLDMLEELGLWFPRSFLHDAMSGANEMAAMSVKRKLSIVGSTDFNMANTED